MKRFILLLITGAFISSCNVLSYRIVSYSVDYSNYTRNGFFITESNSVSFEYDPIASVGTEIRSGFVSSKEYDNIEKSKIKEDSVYGSQRQRQRGNPNKLIYATAEAALSEIVRESKTLGGDALIGLKISSIEEGSILYYYATGMAVKRK